MGYSLVNQERALHTCNFFYIPCHRKYSSQQNQCEIHIAIPVNIQYLSCILIGCIFSGITWIQIGDKNEFKFSHLSRQIHLIHFIHHPTYRAITSTHQNTKMIKLLEKLESVDKQSKNKSYSHTLLGAIVKLTAANWLFQFSNQYSLALYVM